MKSNRISYFDIAKGIGILCIVAGHMGYDPISRIVFTFHVPLFFIISGYFLSMKGNYKEFCIKKAKALLVPYVLTCIVLFLIKIPVNLVLGCPELIAPQMKEVFWAAIYGNGCEMGQSFWNVKAIGAIWFLLALFWSLLFARVCLRKWWGILVAILIALVSYYSSLHFWLPFDLQAAGAALPFVCVGFYLKKYQMLEKKAFCAGTAIVGVLVFGAVLKFDLPFYMVSNEYRHGVLDYLVATAMTGAVLIVSMLVAKTKYLKKVLLFFGENSLMVLCVHIVEMSNFPWRILVYEPLASAGIGFGGQTWVVYLLKIVFITISVLVINNMRKYLKK